MMNTLRQRPTHERDVAVTARGAADSDDDSDDKMLLETSNPMRNILVNINSHEKLSNTALAELADLADRHERIKLFGRVWRIPRLLQSATRFKWLVTATLLLLSFAVHFWRIEEPHQVAFDEVHFGGFASHYLRRTYFFDVHPPLGKLMLAAAGYAMGYDGSFTFKAIGIDYVKGADYVPYIAMRAVPAFCGTLLVPLSYLTMLEFGFSHYGAILAAMLCMFENLFVTQCRFILLDGMLLFFIFCAVYCVAKFRNCARHAFSRTWWTWLALTGVSLTLAISVKLVGLFVVALVGIHTAIDLWRMVGDLELSLFLLLRHFLARAFCLIILPIVGYLIIFSIHFIILDTVGPGTPFMSHEFTQGLRQIANPSHLPTLAAHGAQMSFQHVDVQGYLHSHPHAYPSGSQEQQMTVYAHQDSNNWFIMRHANSDLAEKREYFIDGDEIRLEHVNSEMGVYGKGFPAPVTVSELHTEVSAAAGAGHSWVLEFDTNLTGEEVIARSGDRAKFEAAGTKYHSLKDADTVVVGRTRFRLVRKDISPACALFSHRIVLPAWGWNQYEVTCTLNLNVSGVWWRVDQYQQSKQDKIETTPPLIQRGGFFTTLQDIIDVNLAAWEANRRLTSEHVFASRPLSWPMLSRGVSFWQNHATAAQVYLLGNPLIFWGCIPFLAIYVVFALAYLIRLRRGLYDMDAVTLHKFVFICDFLILGYMLHFLPFFLMDRQLFLHHYLPAHMFAILIASAVFDHITRAWSNTARLSLLFCMVTVVIWGFCHFAFLTYGLSMPSADREARKWREKWDFM